MSVLGRIEDSDPLAETLVDPPPAAPVLSSRQ